jgi:signal transduction histidine kinase/PAS domain-containing protein
MLLALPASMHRQTIRADSPAAEAGLTHVLLVTAPAAPVPSWPDVNGHQLELRVVPGIAAAAAQLEALPFDVVVIDAALAAAQPDDLTALRDRLGNAALLVLSREYTDELAELMRSFGSGACLLPRDAPAPVQAQIVALAAGRARFAAALAVRMGQLERQSRELEESRSRFRDIIERNADAIVVVDRDGMIRYANPVATDLFGTPREDLTGTPFGFPVTVGETTELDLVHPDGARLVEMRVVESEWEGHGAYIASLRDTTERKRAEESARRLIREQTARSAAESAARRFQFQADASTRLSEAVDYAALLSTLARLCADELADWVVVFLVDEDGAVRRVETAHCDPEHDDVVQKLREIAIAPDAQHPALDVLESQTPVLVTHASDADITAMCSDEREVELVRRLGVASYLIVPLVARGRALGALKLVSAAHHRRFTSDDLAVATDLALRAALALDNARLYQHAQQANHAKSDLLAVISHDLRTPLNAIIGYSELLAMGIPDPLSEASVQHVERIGNSARHLLFLIDELSSFARLEAGGTQLNVQEVVAQDVAREVSAVMQPLAVERDLEFRMLLPDQPRTLHTDPDRLRQVLLNLIGNAVKYTERGGITFEVAAKNDGIEFRITDTGAGIAAEHLPHIFEPFWQADPAERSSSRGTGLGLSIVHTLVELLGGCVTVQSEVGAGSTFTVQLPRARRTAM